MKDGPKAGAVRISQCMVASSKALDPRSSTLSDREWIACSCSPRGEPRTPRIPNQISWLNRDAVAQGRRKISPNGCPSRKT